MLWSAGVRAASLTGKLGLEQVRGGRLRVAPTLQVPGHPNVFVIGDAAHVTLTYQGQSIDISKRSKDDVARLTVE